MINIFAKRAFLNTSPNVEFENKEKNYHGRGHLQRVSSMIRGDQIAERIGAKLNPNVIGANDVNIFVKPHVPKGHDFEFPPGRNYMDIIDGWGLLPVLEKHKDVGVIACSKRDQEKLQTILEREIKFIPQHHANYERLHRDSKEIKTIGMIGTEDAFEHLPRGIEEELKKRGIKLLKYSKFFTRLDIINFYMEIDLQIVWRPYRMRLSNPLKIVNASSFGIPTIAYEEEVFQEMIGCYFPVREIQGFLRQVDNFINDPTLYDDISEICISRSEFYHIDNVAKMYKELDK